MSSLIPFFQMMSALKQNRFDFKSTEYRRDPWRVFDEFREQGPVIRMKFPLMGNGWAATTYEAVNRVLKDDDHFVREPKNAGRKRFGSIQWILPRSFMVLAKNMIAKDGQDHRRLRRLVDEAFARRNIDGMSDRIGVLAESQFEIAANIAERDGQVDLIEHFARPFPLTVICELLGMPLQDRTRFRKWFEPMSNISAMLGIFKMSGGFKQMSRYLREQFEIVRKQPREGLMGELVTAHHEGHSFSDDELLAMVFLLVIAGHETTVHLISNCVLTFMQQPAALKALMADWTKCDSAIEEVLRYSSPIQIAKPRFVASDMEFFGQKLKRGELITPLIAAANYDPAKFTQPHTFDIDRKPNYHMTFGSGPHTCLGIKLARTETSHALRTLFSHWPQLQPAFNVTQVDWSPRPGMRGLKTMFVTAS